jgi:hypothetical protein
MRSSTTAMPCPTPIHMVQTANRPPETCTWFTAVVTRRAPEAPSGWPSAIAPPFGLTRGDHFAPERFPLPWATYAHRRCSLDVLVFHRIALVLTKAPPSHSECRDSRRDPLTLTVQRVTTSYCLRITAKGRWRTVAEYAILHFDIHWLHDWVRLS